MAAAGIPDRVAEQLVYGGFSRFPFDHEDDRLNQAIAFFARWHSDLTLANSLAILNFIAWQLRNDPGFSFRGRTGRSMLILASDWQEQMRSARLETPLAWKGLSIRDWTLETDTCRWVVVQLRTNRELLEEGRRQRHCVYSYVDRCFSGHSAIFSLRAYARSESGGVDAVPDPATERSRITIEVDRHKTIVQALGRRDRLPVSDEIRMLKVWAAEVGLTWT